MLIHKCSNCSYSFKISSSTLLPNGWGRTIRSGFLRIDQQLEDYQKVQCPECGKIDIDQRIKSYGLLSPKWVIYLVIALIFIMLFADLLQK